MTPETSHCGFSSCVIYRAANELSLNEPGFVQAQLMVKRFELKSLTQAQFVIIRASSRANVCTLTQFDIYI
jgi:hypothetical protein